MTHRAIEYNTAQHTCSTTECSTIQHNTTRTTEFNDTHQVINSEEGELGDYLNLFHGTLEKGVPREELSP